MVVAVDLLSEEVFPNLGGLGVVNRVIALRDTTTPANQTLEFDTFSQTWKSSDGSIVVSPREGLTNGYDWLIGPGFNSFTGRVDLPVELNADTLYTTSKLPK